MNDLRIQPAALRWMETRAKVPRYKHETTRLPSGINPGTFWMHCKDLRRCGRLPHRYGRLLTNPVLRADYRTLTVARESDRRTKTEGGRYRGQGSGCTDPAAALVLMKGRNAAPTHRDTAPLPGGGKLGKFWLHCKGRRNCGRPPYDGLLTNPVLRVDYRVIATTREIPGRSGHPEVELLRCCSEA